MYVRKQILVCRFAGFSYTYLTRVYNSVTGETSRIHSTSQCQHILSDDFRKPRPGRLRIMCCKKLGRLEQQQEIKNMQQWGNNSLREHIRNTVGNISFECYIYGLYHTFTYILNILLSPSYFTIIQSILHLKHTHTHAHRRTRTLYHTK